MLIRESTLRRLIRQTLNEAASEKSETGSRSCDPLSLGDMYDDIWDALIGGPIPPGWRRAMSSGLGDVKPLSQEGVKIWSAILAMAMHSSKLSEALYEGLKPPPRSEALAQASRGAATTYKEMRDMQLRVDGYESNPAYVDLKKKNKDFVTQVKELEKEYSASYTPHPMQEPLRSGKPWTFENAGSQYTPEEREKITKVLQTSLGVVANGVMDAGTVSSIYNSLKDGDWVTIMKLRRGRGNVVDPFCEADDTELYARAELIVKRAADAYTARAIKIKDEAAGYGAAVQAQKKKQGPSKADLADPDDEFKFDK